MPQPANRRNVGIILAALLGFGLLAFALMHLLGQGGNVIPKPGAVIKKVNLGDAPLAVQEAAMKLSTSRIGYAMPMGAQTYLIISTGQSGERIELAEAVINGDMVNVRARTSSNGDRLLIALLNKQVTNTRMIEYEIDGMAAGIPALINVDQLPLAALPDKGTFVLVGPMDQAKVSSAGVEVSGYARIFEGQFTVQVFNTGKGRILGEAAVSAAAGAPNWGSFRVTVPLNVPAGMTEGVVVVYDEYTGAKQIIPVTFGNK